MMHKKFCLLTLRAHCDQFHICFNPLFSYLIEV